MSGLRQIYVEMRKQQSPEVVERASALACAKLADLILKKASAGAVIGLYRPANPNRFGEADPTALLADPRLAGFHFAYPRVVDRFQSEMDFAVPMHPSDWTTGAFGSPEPHTNLPGVEPNEIELLVVPGVVFGIDGERIGMGAGFYDRYLEFAKGAQRIGFAFDFQLLAEPIPQESWDARMDAVVTDLRVVEVASRPTQ